MKCSLTQGDLDASCVAFANAMMHKVTGIHAVHFFPYMNVRHSDVTVLMLQALLKLN